MRGPWLLFVLNAWQNSGVCHLGEVQVVHVDGRESRKTDSGRIVTDYPLTPLHGEEPWMLTLEGGQVGDVGLMVGHIAALPPRPNADLAPSHSRMGSTSAHAAVVATDAVTEAA